MTPFQRGWSGLRFLALVVLGLGSILPSCGRDSATSAPQELVDTWIPSGELYAGRYLVIKEDRLYFGTGPQEDGESLTIVRVRWEEEVDHTLYSIEYQSPEGDDFTLPIQFFPGKRELRLANRSQVVWRPGERPSKSPRQVL